MRKISFIISIVLVSLLVGGYYAIAGIDNPADPSTVQTPWVGNIDAASFNLSNVGTLGVTTLEAGSITISATTRGDFDFGTSTPVFTPQTITVSTDATTVDWGLGNKAHITLEAATTTFTFTNPSGATNITIKLIQDATGSRTVTWDSDVKWTGGTAPTLTTASTSIDFVSCYFDTSLYFCTDSLDFQ